MKLILGTMTFGPQIGEAGSRDMVKRFVDDGFTELDSAYVYNNGDTENILGAILQDDLADCCKLATKVHPRITGRLDRESIRMQFEESLRRMHRDSVDLLYLHFPTPETPIEETLEACAELHREGKFKELGLSNYPAWMVADLWHLCGERGWPQPTVYQGMYNGLTRSVEAELFPALRRLGMRFYAFNPLAGGMLTGKHTEFGSTPSPGRFARLKSYRSRYWKASYFGAVGALTTTCKEEGIAPAEAAYRWLCYHSMMDVVKGDGLIIGASSISQLERNLLAAAQGCLPRTIVQAFDHAWEEARHEAPPYFKQFAGADTG